MTSYGTMEAVVKLANRTKPTPQCLNIQPLSVPDMKGLNPEIRRLALSLNGLISSRTLWSFRPQKGFCVPPLLDYRK